MSYRLEFKPTARKSLAKIPTVHADRIRKALDLLGENPLPPGNRKIVGSEAKYRIRIGDYRVIYEIKDNQLVIFIIRIAHRKDIYR